MFLGLGIALLVLILDQLSKWWVQAYINNTASHFSFGGFFNFFADRWIFVWNNCLHAKYVSAEFCVYISLFCIQFYDSGEYDFCNYHACNINDDLCFNNESYETGTGKGRD